MLQVLSCKSITIVEMETVPQLASEFLRKVNDRAVCKEQLLREGLSKSG